MADLVVPLPARVALVVNTLGPRAKQAAVDEAVAVLRGSTSSLPVKTGRLKRSYRRLGAGATSQIYSPVSYASFHRGAAVRTVRNHTSRILAAARRGRGQQSTGTPAREFVARREAVEERLAAYSAFRAAMRGGQLRSRAALSRALRLIEDIDRRATG